MRWLIVPLLACLLSCDGTPSTPAQPSASPSPPPPEVITLPTVTLTSHRLPRVVLITGDSEACRVGFYARETIAKLNAENHEPADIIHIDCKGGTVVDYWGKYGNLKRALDKYPDTDDVVIFLGTNHYWNQRDTPDVQPIIDQVTTHALDCTWVGNTAVHGKKWNINNLLRVAVTPTCRYFDTEAADIPLDDGVHPGRAGAVKWLQLVWATIPPKFDEADHD